ncbi:class I SAM-dependent methyltransferase [Acidocella sp.]|uniref:class I SAM-dependent methyltransferase n=1 Tax=Acidocella sp. TaxID=50710 RepID=UPI002F4274E4
MSYLQQRYPDFANPELLEKIPLAASTVLDVGCAQGALGANYLRRNPRALVLGIERNEAAAAIARQRLRDVYCGDVEATPMPFDLPGGIDCIIYGDVLEHLVDPWRLVIEQAKYLAPQGTVLVCMPNVEHWSLAARLLAGQFDYETQGLLDRAHLRWFTPRMMGQALTAAGLELADVAPRPTETGEARRFVAALTPGLRALGLDPEEYYRRAAPLQFIWRARRAAPARLEVNATMLAPLGGVSDVRVTLPLRALRSDSATYTQIQDEADLTPHLPDAPRIAVLHRPLLLGEPGLARLRTLLRQDYVVVSEFDDHPLFMRERGVDLDALLTFRAVHAVQTSTPALAEILRPENPELGVFPNAVFELPLTRNFRDPDRMTLFFGALNRGADWAPLMPVLNEVAGAVGARLQFHVLHDEAFFQALDTPHKKFDPITDYAGYLRMLGTAEIAFMPLADTPFNRAKSDLKFIEAAAARVSALASDVVYAGTIRDGQTGVIFRDATELRAGLLRLLADPEAMRNMAEAARLYVAEERMLAYQVSARSSWYRSLWARRDELNAALRARVPALFE